MTHPYASEPPERDPRDRDPRLDLLREEADWARHDRDAAFVASSDETESAW